MAKDRAFRFVFTGDTKSLEGATSRAGGSLESLGKMAGTAAAGVAIIGTAVVGAGIAAGTALFNLGSDFDSAYDKIRTSTGAIGDELEGLEDSFKTVLASGPDSMEDVSTALSDIRVRLGLTGVDLETLTGQFLDLARVTEGDLATQIDKGTRLFGDWGVAVGDQADVLDSLFRATQASGIGFEELADGMVTAGAPLRNLGFSLEESMAMLSLWNKTGVNSETVMAGMKAGVGKLAKAGEDIPATFRRVVDEITRLGPGTEATGLAIELFGQRAGPDLADAIAGGKFNLEEMLAAIQGGTDTISTAADDTADFAESWDTLKNQLAVAFEPAAMWVFDQVGQAIERAMPHLLAFSEWVKVEATEALAWLGDWWAEHGPAVKQFIGDVRQAFVDMSTGFSESWNSYGKPAVEDIGTAFGNLRESIGYLRGESADGSGGVSADWVMVGKVIGVVAAGIALAVVLIVNRFADVVRSARDTADIVNRKFQSLKDGALVFRDAIQWVIDKLQTLRDKIVSLPNLKLPKFSDPLGSIFGRDRHSGGIVPGASGANVPIMAQAGEMVLSAAQTRQASRSGGGVTVVVNAYGATGREMVAEIERAVRDGVRATWLTTAGVTA